MANADTALSCAQETCVYNGHIFRRVWSIRSWLHWLRPAPKLPLSDHLARDIGLDAHELELLRLQLPSQTTHHPYG